jgi:hypothetical protein
MDINETYIWQKLKDILENQTIPKREIFEVPLPLLGNLLFGHDFNKLKYSNRLLAQILKKKKVRIIRKHGTRFALIPSDILRKKEPKIMACEAWRW